MNKKWNFRKIKSELESNGFYIFKDFFNKKDLKKIKNTLVNSLNYIRPSKEKKLQKKYYQIKKFNPKLKGHWYDMARYDINLLKLLHKPEMINFIKKFYNTEVVFSGRPAIHVHDDMNDRLLDPHQETNQFARDTMGFWVPLYNTNKNNGGIVIYKNSHKHGYFKHTLGNSHAGKKSWTKNYTHISAKIAKKFERVELNVKAGSAVFFLSSLVHCGYPNKKRGSVRITVTERYNPLQKIPFLRDENAPLRMPFMGIDYNKVTD